MSLRIGEVAKQCGVSRDTIRHYEKLGLVVSVRRTAAGYRVFRKEDIERIHLVRNAVRFGFSLIELTKFLRARDNGKPPCQFVRSTAGRILDDINREIADLTVARKAIEATLTEWDRRLAGAFPAMPARLLESLPDDLPARPKFARKNH